MERSAKGQGIEDESNTSYYDAGLSMLVSSVELYSQN